MRRVMAVISVMAVMALTVSAAHAQFQFGMNYFTFSNWENGGGVGSGPAFQPGGWTATTDGAIWTKAANGTYELNWQDLNFQLDFRLTPTSPWVTLTGAYLTSNGVADVDVNFNHPETPAGAYPGYWMGADGATGWGNNNPDSTSPYRMGIGQYYLPGTYNPDYPDGRPTQPGMQFSLYAWLGNDTTFSDALANGAQAGSTGAFQVGTTMYWISPMTSAFTNMPSLVVAAPMPGDANRDGTVNINDLSKVLTNYDQSGKRWVDGDFSGDGTVNINDLSTVLTNYDHTTAAGAGISAVPEPSTLLLVVAGCAGLLMYAWRKRK
jgi:hypothetical protein